MAATAHHAAPLWTLIVVYVTLLTIVLPSRCVSQYVTVTTKSGVVRGRRTYISGSQYLDTFFGIPFAKPPVRTLDYVS
jgi:hypothetical protein